MRERLQRFLERWGQAAQVERQGQAPFTARLSLQPALQKRQEAPVDRTPIGWRDRRRWVCVGAGEPALSAGDRITWAGGRLRLLDATPVYLGEELLCWYGSAAPEPEEAEP